jgi:hypothetical protein
VAVYFSPVFSRRDSAASLPLPVVLPRAALRLRPKDVVEDEEPVVKLRRRRERQRQST